MSDFSDRIAAHAQAVEGKLASAAMTEGGRAAVRRGIRRGRAGRALTVSGAALAAFALVAGVGLGVRGLVQHDPVPAIAPSPTFTPTPSPSPSPEPSASPSPTKTVGADGLALPGFVTADPNLPSASALTESVWSEVANGWILASYSPEAMVGGEPPSVLPRTRNIVYLVSPGGSRYQVLELPPDSGWRLVWWKKGSTTALMCRPQTFGEATQYQRGYCVDYAQVDLRSGDITPIQTDLTSAEFLGVNDRGDLVFSETRPNPSAQYGFSPYLVLRDATLRELASISHPGGWLRVSPSGAYGVEVADAADYLADLYGPSAFVTVNLDTLTVETHTWSALEPGATCEMRGWASTTEVLIVCEHLEWDDAGRGSSASTSFWSLDLHPGATASRISTLGPGVRTFAAGGVIGNQVVALAGPVLDGVGGNTTEAVAIIDGPTDIEIPAGAYGGFSMELPVGIAVVGGTAYITWGDDGESGLPATYLSAYDASTQNSMVLIPPGPAVAAPAYAVDNMTGCVIVGYAVPCG